MVKVEMEKRGEDDGNTEENKYNPLYRFLRIVTK